MIRTSWVLKHPVVLCSCSLVILSLACSARAVRTCRHVEAIARRASEFAQKLMRNLERARLPSFFFG